VEFLATLWSKLNKPIHFLTVGAAIILFSPVEYHWIGGLFVAFGLAGSVEWLWKHAIHAKEELQRRHAMGRIISYLNTDEKEVIRPQLEKNEQTFYLNWNDYHGIHADDDAADEYSRLAGIYKGLSAKGIIRITAEDTVASCHFIDPAWKMLLKSYNKDQKFLSTPAPDNPE
jgi:hypothetical protein